MVLAIQIYIHVTTSVLPVIQYTSTSMTPTFTTHGDETTPWYRYFTTMFDLHRRYNRTANQQWKTPAMNAGCEWLAPPVGR